MTHTVDVVLQLLVGVHRHVGGKILVSAQAAELMTLAILRVGSTVEQMAQHFLLKMVGFGGVPSKFFLTWQKQFSCYAGKAHRCCIYIVS